MNKFEWRNALFIFALFIFLVIIGLIVTFDKEPDVSDDYYHHYPISLKGVIIDKKRIDDRHECYKMNIISSNVKSHDLRGNGGKYFLYINNDNAFLMSSHLNLNDTLDIDYATKHMDVLNINSNSTKFHGLPRFISGYRELVKMAEAYMY